ncbi:toprim domain-containing protein [Candidatus Dojkabacteria bacterium]|uniref:Toprim domain-containing protein n=1 Tax=Candidatus Dojkabacteria bacterium TaxID=2099670 RepID=A0A955RH88_9BACT|nr:toprim domain-containing protein [Candidatus Dojkabacteria bacterium]
MGICIDKLPHSCGTKKGLQVFANEETGKVDGFCFACHKRIANPYGKEKTIDEVDLPKPKTEAEIQAEIAEIDGYPVVDLKDRKLRAKYIERFGSKIALSEEDGKTPIAIYHPMTINDELTGYYIKTLSKPSYEWSIGEVKNAQPFGWLRAKRSGAYRLIITEGREDAIAIEALFDMYGNEEFKPAIISLSNGTNSVKKNLTPIAKEIQSLFKEVVINFDNDSSGEKATQEALLILPGALSAILPEKDANDCLINGSGKAAYKALAFNAKRPKNTRLLVANKELHYQFRQPTQHGELTWFSPTLQKLLRGVRLGETIYEGAGVKMGKSELLNAQAAHHMIVDNVPVLVAKPEEAAKDTYKLIANKFVGNRFHDPDVPFDYDEFDRAGEMMDSKLYMIDLYQHLGWDTLRSDIIYAANDGVKAVFIDPITNLTAGLNSADANAFLTGFARDISAIAKDKNLVVFLFCHLKAPEGTISLETRQKQYSKGIYHGLGNCPHEMGGTIYSNQFAGSRAMMQACNLMLGLEGNKDPDLDEVTRHTRWVRILEDRQFGNSGTIPLYYNEKTTMYKEI